MPTTGTIRAVLDEFVSTRRLLAELCEGAGRSIDDLDVSVQHTFTDVKSFVRAAHEFTAAGATHVVVRFKPPLEPDQLGVVAEAARVEFDIDRITRPQAGRPDCISCWISLETTLNPPAGIAAIPPTSGLGPSRWSCLARGPRPCLGSVSATHELRLHRPLALLGLPARLIGFRRRRAAATHRSVVPRQSE